jgi:hypothetical protein
MTTPLFLDQNAKITFEKVGMPIKLSDNVDNWQREISSEIFKYLPFLSEYSVNVAIQRVNPERGYAFGAAQVQARGEGQSSGSSALIPLIVIDRILKPVDVFFHNSEAMPMSEDRLREALFDGRTFETSDRKPTDQGMVDQMYPPIRTNYGYGSGVTTGAASGGAGFGKFASLCSAIATTVPIKEAEELLVKLASDPQLEAAVKINKAFQKVASDLICVDRVPVSKTAAALVRSINPTVVQFVKLADGNFSIKWANAQAFAPQQENVPPSTAQEMAGTDAIQGMNPGDSVTLGTGESDDFEDNSDMEVEEPGIYEVTVEEDGSRRVGVVLPVMDFDGTLLPLNVFTDGEVYSLQDDIAGTPVEDVELEEVLPVGDHPDGNGAFVFSTENGVVCSQPLTIQNQISNEDGTGYLAETAMGEQITLLYCPGLQDIQQLDESTYSLPEDAVWTPLSEAVHVVKTHEDSELRKEASAIPKRGFLRSTGIDEFHLDGIPFEKLANDKKHWIDKNAAEFLLVTSGLNALQAREKIAAARRLGMVEVDGLQSIKPLDHLHQETIKEAAEVLKQFPYELRKDTIKLAAALDDAESADKILAMSFLNPENISIFASYLPQLDETAKKLAEMLIASRLGMKQIDEGALERAMRNTEEVIQGLRGLQQKQLI